MPHADFLASIDNSSKTPRLQYFAAIDRSSSWKRITSRFARTLPSLDAFPASLSPFFLLRVEACPVLRIESLKCRCDGEVACQEGLLLLHGRRVPVRLSPVIRLTLDEETRRIADIHPDAVSVAYMHPMEEQLDMCGLTRAEEAALTNGAFANFSAPVGRNHGRNGWIWVDIVVMVRFGRHSGGAKRGELQFRGGRAQVAGVRPGAESEP